MKKKKIMKSTKIINSYFSGIASNYVRADGKLNEFVTVGGSGKQITADDVKRWSTENLWKSALGKARVRTRKADCRKKNKDADTPNRQIDHIEPTNLDMNGVEDAEIDEPSETNDDDVISTLIDGYLVQESSVSFEDF